MLIFITLAYLKGIFDCNLKLTPLFFHTYSPPKRTKLSIKVIFFHRFIFLFSIVYSKFCHIVSNFQLFYYFVIE